MASRAIVTLVVGVVLLVVGVVTAATSIPTFLGSALSEPVEISPKGYHNVTTDFDTNITTAFLIFIENYSAGDSIEAYLQGPGNVTYGELTLDSASGTATIATNMSGSYTLVIHNPGPKSLQVRYLFGPTFSPTMILTLAVGGLLLIAGVIIMIIGAVFAVIDRKGRS